MVDGRVAAGHATAHRQSSSSPLLLLLLLLYCAVPCAAVSYTYQPRQCPAGYGAASDASSKCFRRLTSTYTDHAGAEARCAAAVPSGGHLASSTTPLEHAAIVEQCRGADIPSWLGMRWYAVPDARNPTAAWQVTGYNWTDGSSTSFSTSPWSTQAGEMLWGARKSKKFYARIPYPFTGQFEYPPLLMQSPSCMVLNTDRSLGVIDCSFPMLPCCEAPARAVGPMQTRQNTPPVLRSLQAPNTTAPKRPLPSDPGGTACVPEAALPCGPEGDEDKPCGQAGAAWVGTRRPGQAAGGDTAVIDAATQPAGLPPGLNPAGPRFGRGEWPEVEVVRHGGWLNSTTYLAYVPHWAGRGSMPIMLSMVAEDEDVVDTPASTLSYYLLPALSSLPRGGGGSAGSGGTTQEEEVEAEDEHPAMVALKQAHLTALQAGLPHASTPAVDAALSSALPGLTLSSLAADPCRSLLNMSSWTGWVFPQTGTSLEAYLGTAFACQLVVMDGLGASDDATVIFSVVRSYASALTPCQAQFYPIVTGALGLPVDRCYTILPSTVTNGLNNGQQCVVYPDMGLYLGNTSVLRAPTPEFVAHMYGVFQGCLQSQLGQQTIYLAGRRDYSSPCGWTYRNNVPQPQYVGAPPAEDLPPPDICNFLDSARASMLYTLTADPSADCIQVTLAGTSTDFPPPFGAGDKLELQSITCTALNWQCCESTRPTLLYAANRPPAWLDLNPVVLIADGAEAGAHLGMMPVFDPDALIPNTFRPYLLNLNGTRQSACALDGCDPGSPMFLFSDVRPDDTRLTGRVQTLDVAMHYRTGNLTLRTNVTGLWRSWSTGVVSYTLDGRDGQGARMTAPANLTVIALGCDPPCASSMAWEAIPCSTVTNRLCLPRSMAYRPWPVRLATVAPFQAGGPANGNDALAGAVVGIVLVACFSWLGVALLVWLILLVLGQCAASRGVAAGTTAGAASQATGKDEGSARSAALLLERAASALGVVSLSSSAIHTTLALLLACAALQQEEGDLNLLDSATAARAGLSPHDVMSVLRPDGTSWTHPRMPAMPKTAAVAPLPAWATVRAPQALQVAAWCAIVIVLLHACLSAYQVGALLRKRWPDVKAVLLGVCGRQPGLHPLMLSGGGGGGAVNPVSGILKGGAGTGAPVPATPAEWRACAGQLTFAAVASSFHERQLPGLRAALAHAHALRLGIWVTSSKATSRVAPGTAIGSSNGTGTVSFSTAGTSSTVDGVELTKTKAAGHGSASSSTASPSDMGGSSRTGGSQPKRGRRPSTSSAILAAGFATAQASISSAATSATSSGSAYLAVQKAQALAYIPGLTRALVLDTLLSCVLLSFWAVHMRETVAGQPRGGASVEGLIASTTLGAPGQVGAVVPDYPALADPSPRYAFTGLYALFALVSILQTCLSLRTLALPLLGSFIQMGGQGATIVTRRASLVKAAAADAGHSMQVEMSRLAARATAAADALRAAQEVSRTNGGIDDLLDISLCLEGGGSMTTVGDTATAATHASAGTVVPAVVTSDSNSRGGAGAGRVTADPPSTTASASASASPRHATASVDGASAHGAMPPVPLSSSASPRRVHEWPDRATRVAGAGGVPAGGASAGVGLLPSPAASPATLAGRSAARPAARPADPFLERDHVTVTELTRTATATSGTVSGLLLHTGSGRSTIFATAARLESTPEAGELEPEAEVEDGVGHTEASVGGGSNGTEANATEAAAAGGGRGADAGSVAATDRLPTLSAGRTEHLEHLVTEASVGAGSGSALYHEAGPPTPRPASVAMPAITVGKVGGGAAARAMDPRYRAGGHSVAAGGSGTSRPHSATSVSSSSPRRGTLYYAGPAPTGHAAAAGGGAASGPTAGGGRGAPGVLLRGDSFASQPWSVGSAEYDSAEGEGGEGMDHVAEGEGGEGMDHVAVTEGSMQYGGHGYGNGAVGYYYDPRLAAMHVYPPHMMMMPPQPMTASGAAGGGAGPAFYPHQQHQHLQPPYPAHDSYAHAGTWHMRRASSGGSAVTDVTLPADPLLRPGGEAPHDQAAGQGAGPASAGDGRR